MLLAIDVGNTTISFGILKGKNVFQLYAIETCLQEQQLKPRVKKLIGEIVRKYPNIEGSILCSVAPKAAKTVTTVATKYLKKKPYIVGRDIHVPIKNKYRNPRQVGQDRLVCAYAASNLYGKPVIVIDFGTAITFDIVSAQGDYEGGIIVPGIRLSAEALFRKTALLPQIETIKSPKVLVGKDTEESILSGIFFGYGVMCCGLIDLLRKGNSPKQGRKALQKAKVIVTGGYTHLMKKYIASKITTIDKNLVFKGMYLLYSDVKKH